MHPDLFPPSGRNATGTSGHDELQDFWFQMPRPIWRDASDGVLVILIAAATVVLLGVAFLDGLARVEARPLVCDGTTAPTCRALMSEGGVQ